MSASIEGVTSPVENIHFVARLITSVMDSPVSEMVLGNAALRSGSARYRKVSAVQVQGGN